MSSHSISEIDVNKLADLARLAITEEEVAFFQKDIESILGFIDTIQDVEVPAGELKSEGFPPLGYTREDSPQSIPESLSPEELVAAAPTHTDNAVRVKKILS